MVSWFWLKHDFGQYGGVFKVSAYLSNIHEVSSDAKYFDSNLTEAILLIFTSVSCISKHFPIVSSFRLMHFVPPSSNWKQLN